MIDSIDADCLERLRGAVAVARARAWQLRARPERALAQEQKRTERTVLDLDATLTTAHSDKEQA